MRWRPTPGCLVRGPVYSRRGVVDTASHNITIHRIRLACGRRLAMPLLSSFGTDRVRSLSQVVVPLTNHVTKTNSPQKRDTLGRSISSGGILEIGWDGTVAQKVFCVRDTKVTHDYWIHSEWVC